MTENKRFTILYETEENPMEWDLIDNQEDCLIVLGNGKVICDLLNELYDENEQLKKENYKLHKRLGDFEPFEEHIKERTSKTSVNDIIGLVKTDEQTNSVELKKELYK